MDSSTPSRKFQHSNLRRPCLVEYSTMHEMTVQELIDYLTGLPKDYMFKKIILDQNSPVPEFLCGITALESEEALLFKGPEE